MPKGGQRTAGPGKKIGRPRTRLRLTGEEFEAIVKDQGGMCALCSEPGSVGGLVVDVDEVKKKVRGLVHPECKNFLALGHDNPIRFQTAISYLNEEPPTPGRR